MKEIWKDIKGFEGKYQVSSLGRVKSLSRVIKLWNCDYVSKGKILKSSPSSRGYLNVALYKEGIRYTSFVHQLVAQSFLNHSIKGYDMVVNHKNFNTIDNRLCNLEVVTQRYNAGYRKKDYTSKFVGVNWCKRSNKWVASININGKKKFLGYFIDELKARDAYLSKVKEL